MYILYMHNLVLICKIHYMDGYTEPPSVLLQHGHVGQDLATQITFTVYLL